MFSLRTPKEHARLVAERVRSYRIAKGFTLKRLSEQSGVSFSSYRRFERTGEISFVSLISVAQVLGCEQQINNLFSDQEFASLDEIDAVERKSPKHKR